MPAERQQMQSTGDCLGFRRAFECAAVRASAGNVDIDAFLVANESPQLVLVG
jgi:hypothetical protein